MESFKKFTPLLLAACLLLGALACESIPSLNGPNGVSSACVPGQAQLAVYDAFLQNLCGCDEPTEEVFPPNSLTCTVRPGTVVYFWYFNNILRHQIQSAAQPTFPTSPLSDPSSSNQIKTHVVTLTAPGNYEFNDAYNNAMNGTIVVQ